MKKKIILIIGVLFLTISTFAQSPEKMSYQALIRNSADVVLSNKTVNMKISIVQSSSDGTIVYAETKTTDTNINGLVSIEIGSGSVVFGSFSLIDWSDDTSYFIKIETDIDDDSSYDISTTSQLLSVPYALYAKTSGSSTPGPQGADGVKGDTGAAGAAGPQGIPGDTGADGVKGDTGAAGTNGENGAQGMTGDTGADGVKGDTGAAGANGENGAQGATGAAGPQGIPGDTGVDGVKGDTGAAGTNGENGAQGATGAAGPQGIPGDTGVDGVKGDTGAAGTNGENGAQGAAGAAGAQGIPGDTGADGVKGDTGAAGANGENGAQGATGAAGAQGITGDTGADGVKGDTGAQGQVGAAGNDATNFWTESGSDIYRTSGDVGVGTTKPSEKLDVVGNINSNGLYLNNQKLVTNDGFGRVEFFNANGQERIEFNGSNTHIQNAVVLIQESLKVGAGASTSDPAANLEIVGTTRITGLSGTGDRMVVADEDGDLSTQAIASGPTGPQGETGPAGADGLLTDGTQVGQMNYWNGNNWKTINPGNSGALLQMVGTTPTWVSNADNVAPVVTVASGTDTVEMGSAWTDTGATADTGESVVVSGAVDTSTVGTYTITYTATDASGNVGTATRTVTVVDTTAPVVTVISGTDTVAQFSSWTDAGATADTGESVVVSGTVDINTAGTYTVTYTATDASGNIGTATRTVTVVDTTTPVVTVTNGTDTVAQFSSWTDAGATADTGESVIASGEVDNNTGGTYTITYTATDAAGNVGTATRTVTVVDTTAPVITVTVGTDTVAQFSSWTDAGATADTGESVIASGSVDMNMGGTYTITYTATDVSGNIGTAIRMVTVVDTTAPDVTVTVGTDTVEKGFAWTDAGATADTGESVVVSGAVDTATVGTYTITYTATDASGNVGTATRTVTVVDTTAPVVTVTSGTDTVEKGSAWTDAGATADTGEPVVVSGTVDTATIGTYIIIYLAVDASGNVGTATRTVTVIVDTTTPVLTVTVGTDTVEKGSAWTDAGATADTGESVVVSGAVDTSTVGTYTITYTATDAAGNVGTATRTVIVVDTTAPVLTVTVGTDTVEKGSAWTDAGATADTGESVVVSGAVDTATVGIYTITYTATDASGNIGTATRTVTVVDTTAPVLTVISGTDSVAQFSSWTDAGATADTGESVIVSGAVDNNTGGAYIITYTATDASGNIGTATRTVTVVDTTAPVITVTVGTDTVAQFSSWTDAGATADTGESVIVSGSVDINIGGTYTITYTATDASGNVGTATRTVTVVDTTAPVITVTGGTDTAEKGSTWTDAGATADTGESVAVTGTVDINTVGTYTIIYLAIDAAENVGTATRTVTVVDTTAPVVTVTSGTDTVAQFSSWTDVGAIADTGESVVVSGTVDINTAGTYTVTYTATDASGNIGTATRTVTVVDTTAPVVTVTSGTDTVAQFSSWTDAGATADTGESVIVLGAVDTNTGGAYTITYTATDAAGNIGTATRTVTVVDTTAPVVTITSATDTLAQDYTWTDAGANADTGESAVVSGTVDTSIPGTYTITYTSTDASGNIGTATRTVTVIARIITLNYTGSAQTFIVPAGVSTIQVEVVAAAGGMPGWGINHPRSAGYISYGNTNSWATVTDASRAGKGGKITADFDVSSLNGQTLQINVGGEGAWGGTHYSDHNVGSNAFNGGGRGYDYKEYMAGAGASDIRIGSYSVSDRIIVAGAGGASSMWESSGWYTFVPGGAGGGQTGGTGTQGINGAQLGGTGGNQSAGGLGGAAGYHVSRPYGNDNQGSNGQGSDQNGDVSGVGNGGNCGTYYYFQGGGGGAGYHGGGAGYTGGGGSSYSSGTYFSNVSDTQGFWPNTSSAEYSSSNSHGYIKITIL